MKGWKLTPKEVQEIRYIIANYEQFTKVHERMVKEIVTKLEGLYSHKQFIEQVEKEAKIEVLEKAKVKMLEKSLDDPYVLGIGIVEDLISELEKEDKKG